MGWWGVGGAIDVAAPRSRVQGPAQWGQNEYFEIKELDFVPSRNFKIL